DGPPRGGPQGGARRAPRDQAALRLRSAARRGVRPAGLAAALRVDGDPGQGLDARPSAGAAGAPRRGLIGPEPGRAERGPEQVMDVTRSGPLLVLRWVRSPCSVISRCQGVLRSSSAVGYGVIGSTSDSGSFSLGSSPGTPADDRQVIPVE